MPGISRPAVTTTYLEYLFPGILMPEISTGPVSSRDPQRAAREAPPHAFAFRFYDVITTTVWDTPLWTGEINASGRYYIDAEKLTIADVEALPGNHRILLGNMRINGWDPVLRCRTGNFQPLQDGDELISGEGA